MAKERKPEIAIYFKTYLKEPACPFKMHFYTKRTRHTERNIYYFVVKLEVKERSNDESKRAQKYLYRFIHDATIVDFRWWEDYNDDDWENSEYLGHMMS